MWMLEIRFVFFYSNWLARKKTLTNECFERNGDQKRCHTPNRIRHGPFSWDKLKNSNPSAFHYTEKTFFYFLLLTEKKKKQEETRNLPGCSSVSAFGGISPLKHFKSWNVHAQHTVITVEIRILKIKCIGQLFIGLKSVFLSSTLSILWRMFSNSFRLCLLFSTQLWRCAVACQHIDCSITAVFVPQANEARTKTGVTLRFDSYANFYTWQVWRWFWVMTYPVQKRHPNPGSLHWNYKTQLRRNKMKYAASSLWFPFQKINISSMWTLYTHPNMEGIVVWCGSREAV